MPRPPKAVANITGKHSKAELKAREKEEAAYATGKPIREHDTTRNNEDAHAEFLRIKELLAKCGKDDGLFEQVINRYCMLSAETKRLEGFLKCETDSKRYVELDKQLMNKRKMMFDIEKENAMTVQAAVRAIPKAPSNQDKNPILAALMDSDSGG